jgi:hypothetical protein
MFVAALGKEDDDELDELEIEDFKWKDILVCFFPFFFFDSKSRIVGIFTLIGSVFIAHLRFVYYPSPQHPNTRDTQNTPNPKHTPHFSLSLSLSHHSLPKRPITRCQSETRRRRH